MEYKKHCQNTTSTAATDITVQEYKVWQISLWQTRACRTRY